MERSISDQYPYSDKFLNALADAFRLQENILNATDIAIYSVSPDGMITSFNRAAEDLFGYKGSEVIGKTTPLAFHDLEEIMERSHRFGVQGNSNPPVFEIFTRKVLSSREPYRDEWTMVRKDGSRFDASLSLTALRDDQDKLVGYIGIPADISDAKRYREEARVTEQKFRILAENIPGAIYLCEKNPPYKTIFVNDYIETITGHQAADFLSGKVEFADLIEPDDAQRVRDEITRSVDEKVQFHLQYRLIHRDGRTRWVDEVGVGVYENGNASMLEGFLTDITTQREAEEHLQQIAFENLQVFNNAVNLNVIAGFDGYFRRVSATWNTVTGWSDDELRSTPYIRFVHPADKAETLEMMQYIKDGNNLFTFENRFRCKDGSYRWFLWGSSPDVKAQIIYASAIDITERKKSEEKLVNSKKNLEAIAVKLQEQNRQLDEFAHIISHNLRSPIGNIQALINLLDDSSSMQDYKVIFEKLKNVSKNLGETMNDLMDTLKAKTSPDVERVDIRFKEMLDKVVQSLEGELIVAEASVTFDFNRAPTISYSRPYLESIIQNLLTNAVKYRSPERRPAVHFETEVVNEAIELRVTDNGQGIDMEKFGDELFGLHRTFHSHEKARGVGLFLTKTQVESLGGSISATSEPGKGTTFIIRFS